jgi:hypothetical protein
VAEKKAKSQRRAETRDRKHLGDRGPRSPMTKKQQKRIGDRGPRYPMAEVRCKWCREKILIILVLMKYIK